MTFQNKFHSSALMAALSLGLLSLPLACTTSGSEAGTAESTETTAAPGDGDGDATGDGDGDPAGDGDGDPPDCAPGTFGCPCNGGLCDMGLMCVDGLCELGGTPCTPGTLDCECDNGMCEAGLVCNMEMCEEAPLEEGPYDNCGWNGGSGWYACGYTQVSPAAAIDCTETYNAGDPCPDTLTVVGCCNEYGNNLWCEGGTVAYENCGGEEPGDGDGDVGTSTGDGDGDIGTSTGDGDGDIGTSTGDGDGDAPP